MAFSPPIAPLARLALRDGSKGQSSTILDLIYRAWRVTDPNG